MSLGYGYGLWRGNFSSDYKYKWSLLGVAPGLVSTPNGITFSCASTRTAQTSPSALITGISANQAVICYNPFLGVYGLQHEPSATNTQYYSQAFASWTNVGATVTTGQTDPSGATNAALIQGSSTTFIVASSRTLAATNGAVTTYWIAGFNGSPNQADWCSGAASVAQVMSYENTSPALAWQRTFRSTTSAVDIVGTTIAYSGPLNTGSNSAANKAYYFGGQIEAGLIPTSYIPTTTTAVTRSASIITANLASWSKWAARLDAYPNAQAAYATNFLIFESTNVNRYQAYVNLATSHFVLIVNNVGILTDSSYAYVFVAGDKWSWRATYDGTTYTVKAYKNNILQCTHSVAGSAVTGGGVGISFGSRADGTLHINAPIVFIGAT